MDTTSSEDPAEDAARAFARAVGVVVARLRSERGWSLEDLADEAGRHRTYIGLIERGERHLSVASAFRLAQALGLPLSELIDLAEARLPRPSAPIGFSRRDVGAGAASGEETVRGLTGLSSEWIPAAIESTYETLDRIDEQLLRTGSQPLAEIVELANLSAIVGNLLRSALQKHSGGAYQASAPHTFPDLVATSAESRPLEIKVALETNMPKGHLPKPGVHLICRYVLAERDGTYSRGTRGNVVWIWEVRLGELSEGDFNTSGTPGDSGKTAVVKADALYGLACAYYDARFLPLAKPRADHW